MNEINYIIITKQLLLSSCIPYYKIKCCYYSKNEKRNLRSVSLYNITFNNRYIISTKILYLLPLFNNRYILPTKIPNTIVVLKNMPNTVTVIGIFF